MKNKNININNMRAKNIRPFTPFHFLSLPFTPLLFLLLSPLTSQVQAQNGTWTVFDTRSSDICSNNISAIAADENGLWAGTYQGLCRMKRSTWTDYAMFNEKLKNQSVNCLMVDQRGVLWIGTDDYGVIEWDGTHWTEYSEETRRLKMKFVKEIVIDHDGVVWIGVTLGGVVSYDGSSWEKYTPADCELLSDFILDIAVDRDNKKWITSNGGVSVYDGTRWVNYTTSNSNLPDNIVPAIAIDKDNVKWFGTLSGLASFDGKRWRVWNTKNSPLPGNQVNDIAIDGDGLLWVGTDKGAAVFDGESNWVAFTPKNCKIPSGNIYKVTHDPQGNHWFGNDNRGLSRLSGFTMPASSGKPSNKNSEQEASDENVRINPHLADGYITISLESPSATVTFTNKDGKVVKTVEDYKNNQKIKIHRMPKGMYIVGVKTVRGEKKIKFNLK